MSSKKRKRVAERGTIHPRNKYSEKPPDFRILASLYPSFEPFVFYSSKDGRPRIDWTDYNATRELTRVLLLHDHGLNWWIPDGQLCPTVPNRSNYIHWIEDLLASDLLENFADGTTIKGFDIGTGANCIYPLLGASLLGWRFVGSDVTDVALEWAEKNVKNNPHISELIEIRKVEGLHVEQGREGRDGGVHGEFGNMGVAEIESSVKSLSGGQDIYHGSPILLGVVKEGEIFDFCMCNPPFFEAMEEAGLNPKTACGGTREEMVCPGGEKAFIMQIIEDSVQLKQSFRWYTSMIGRKSNLKILMAKLREVGVTVVKTTEFVQGHTCRWGLAWSFVPHSKKITCSHVPENKNQSFVLEGLERRYSAFNVLQSAESFFSSSGASCKLDSACFKIDVNASEDQYENILRIDSEAINGARNQCGSVMSNAPSHSQSSDIHFSISVFQQIPGTLLVKGTLQQKGKPGSFSSLFQKLEAFLKGEFRKPKPIAEISRYSQQRQHSICK